MDATEVLFELYKEQRQLGLHHEEQRQAATGLLLTVAAGLIAVITFDGKVTFSDLPMALVVVLTGVLAALLSLKHYERFTFHRQRSRMIRQAMDAALRCGEQRNDGDRELHAEIRRSVDLKEGSSANLVEALIHRSNEKYKEKKHFLSGLPLHTLWAAIGIIISLMGALLSLQACLR